MSLSKKELREKKAEYLLLERVLDKMKNRDNPAIQEMIKLKEKLGLETGLSLPIEERVYAFLIKNDLSPLIVPTIQLFGQYPGGYSLVREIATKHGGMKKVKELYAQKYSTFATANCSVTHFLLRHGLPVWDEEELIG